MAVAAAFAKVREALIGVQRAGQKVVDIKALLTFIESVEAQAPHDQEARRLDHEAQLAQFRADQERGLAHYKAQVDDQQEMLRSVMETAKAALTTALLVNGGATIALLAFLGNLSKGNEASAPVPFVSALIAFAAGVLSSAVATGMAYFTQYCYHVERWRTGRVFHVVAVLLVFSAYAAFAAGVVFAAKGFLK